MDGFCLIVSIVKAQAAHTPFSSTRVSQRAGHPKKGGSSLARPFSFSASLFLTSVIPNAQRRDPLFVAGLVSRGFNQPANPSLPAPRRSVTRNIKKGSLTGCPFSFRLFFSADCHPEREAEGPAFPPCLLLLRVAVSTVTLNSASRLPPFARLHQRARPRQPPKGPACRRQALSFRAKPANFFFLLRSHEEVGRRSREISLRLSRLRFGFANVKRNRRNRVTEIPVRPRKDREPAVITNVKPTLSGHSPAEFHAPTRP